MGPFIFKRERADLLPGIITTATLLGGAISDFVWEVLVGERGLAKWVFIKDYIGITVNPTIGG